MPKARSVTFKPGAARDLHASIAAAGAGRAARSLVVRSAPQDAIKMPPYHTTARPVILAPNWLGDAVMALPAIADVRRALPQARITIAARPSIAPLYCLLAESRAVDDVVTIQRRGWRELGVDLQGKSFDAALLLPNSLHAALIASRAGIGERWGYRSDCRGRLLTRAIVQPVGLHQIEYYQQLVHALGFPNGPIEPRIDVPESARAAAATLLQAHASERPSPARARVAIAPGAAYGGAKKWPASSFAALARSLSEDGIDTVMIGSAADRRTADDVVRAFVAGGQSSLSTAGSAAGPPAGRGALHDLVGRTDLSTLAGVLASVRTLVTNDSGAMHLAAAVGTPVTAVFGPTDERATRPLGEAHAILTGPAWCRPCMLRECPLDHRCMRGIEVAPVLAAARRAL